MENARILFGAVIGLVFGVAAMFATLPAFAAFSDSSDAWPLLIVVFSVMAGSFAPTIRRAFGRGFLLLGAGVFVLPLSTLLLVGRISNDIISRSDAKVVSAVSSGLAGAVMTGGAMFIGFFLGGVLLIIGLILALGGRREVIVVHHVSPPSGPEQRL